MLEARHPAATIDGDADGVEADLPTARPNALFAKVGGRQAADAPALALVKGVPGGGRARGPARLDLHEDQAAFVGDDQVDLSETGPVIASHKGVSEALEVLQRESLPGPAQYVSRVGPRGGHEPNVGAHL